MQMMQGNHTDTADSETVPYNTNALRLDACCLFLIFTTTQSGFEIERLIRGLGALNSGLFYVCDDVARESSFDSSAKSASARWMSTPPVTLLKPFSLFAELRAVLSVMDAVLTLASSR